MERRGAAPRSRFFASKSVCGMMKENDYETVH